MREALSITALSRSTGVPSKTLRYWEELALLPRAMRSHTGYRLFTDDSVQYVGFILKAKSLGLTLREIKRILGLARTGKNPCPEVARLVGEKVQLLQKRIEMLQVLRRRLKRLNQTWSAKPVANCFRPAELCCLIEDLPDPNPGGIRNAKTARSRFRGAVRNRR